ncbi:MAG: GDP-L-fucose synthase [archaeon]|nr:GDP-L-fucose synthase [archaeon]
MKTQFKIFITGANGMVGKSLSERLKLEGYDNLFIPSSSELDLRNQRNVEEYFLKNQFDYVFHLAAKVGGISANMKDLAGFLYNNLLINLNVIESARKNNVKKLIYLGSSCIYPRNCDQPIKEEDLLSGKLEPTNEGYALSKIVGLKLCEYYNKQQGTNFMCLMPCNLYGPNDTFDPEKSHVIPALIKKFSDAKQKDLPHIEMWGKGDVRREFLYVEDLTEAIIYFMKNYDSKDLEPFINIGFGKDITIKELVHIIKDLTGYSGEIKWDPTKPEGMPRKLLDISKADKLGWKARTDIRSGLEKTIIWYKNKFHY